MSKRVVSSEPPIKIAFIGESSVGKSSLVMRLRENRFTECTESTIGAAFCTIRYPIPSSSTSSERPRHYHVWDTAGQERYSSLIPMYLSGASVIVMIYDITNRYSFERINQYWIPYMRNNLRMKDDETFPMLYLIGNKQDMVSKRQVSQAEGEQIAAEHGMGFSEVSAKTGDGSPIIMEKISKHVDDLILRQAENIKHDRNSMVDLTAPSGFRYLGCCGF